MAFCVECGVQIPEDAKFCPRCGRSVCPTNTKEHRVIDYAGKIIKCPSCGEPLKAFQTICPVCGHELRDTLSSSSITKFTYEISKSKNEEQTASLIRNFPIPNNREDILEFLILASSNMQSTLSQVIFESWKVKFEQSYRKAEILISDEEREQLQSIFQSAQKAIRENELYNEILEKENIRCVRRRNISKSLKSIWVHWWWPIISVILIAGALLCIPHLENFDRERKNFENERLAAIESEIIMQLNNNEYKYALMNAMYLSFPKHYYDEDMERTWDIKREYWIDRILSEAEKKGVYLEYPEIEHSNDATEQEYASGFVKGFYEAAQPGIEAWNEGISEIKEAIDTTEGK